MVSREYLEGLLRENRYEEVIALARNDRRAVRILSGLLYHEEELVMWRAVTMLGHLAVAEPEQVRPVVGRLVWSLAEEASIVGWGSAPALAEIYRRNPGIAGNAGRIAVHYMDDEELSLPANRNTVMLAGSIWAVGEIAEADRKLALEMGPKLVAFLADPDPGIRALSAWALGRTGYKPAGPALRKLEHDGARASIYESEELRHVTVGTVAAEAADIIEGSKRH